MARPATAGRWYTRIRRLPTYVGNVGGEPLGIGPFRLPPMPLGQLLCGVVLVFVVMKTSHIWAVGSLLENLLMGAIPVVGGTIAAGFLPWGGRSFSWAILGALRQWASPIAPSYGGRPLRQATPFRYTGRISLHTTQADTRREPAGMPAEPEPATTPQPSQPTAPTAPRLTPVALSLARSAVQQRSARVA